MSATDHLANERTFLAYVRTSLAFIGFGFVVARFAVYLREFALIAHQQMQTGNASLVFGVLMVAVGIGIGVLGGWRYARERAAIEQGTAAGLSATAATAITVIIAIVGLVTGLLIYRV